MIKHEYTGLIKISCDPGFLESTYKSFRFQFELLFKNNSTQENCIKPNDQYMLKIQAIVP